ncbi:hypothetical protein Tco_0626546 [Tanacetum coccineum]|uniref:Uncharacterized protein n=1 Tax=Tanacetum coccineum TaxID=301880 RepID=A0ABQ4WJY1_9ASTR
MGLPARVLDEGISKTKPLPEGPNKDNDSERNKPIANIKSSTPPVTALSGTDAEDQDDVFEVGDEMDEDIQEPGTKETQTIIPLKLQMKNLRHKSISLHHQSRISLNPSMPRRMINQTLHSLVAEDNWDKHEEATTSYAKPMATVEGYYEENIGLTKWVSKTLKADSVLKEAMKKMDNLINNNSGNITSLTKLFNNAKLLEILTQLNAFQTSLNTLSSQCANMFESLKEEPEFYQRLPKAAEGYI